MKQIKKFLSVVIVVSIITAILSTGFAGFAVSTDSGEKTVNVSAGSGNVLTRPNATFTSTAVTRVAYATNSLVAPTASNSVIVAATPSGVPLLSEQTFKFASQAYAGETPQYTKLTFTPGVTLSSEPVITCDNSTVSFSTVTMSNNNTTYSWDVVGGTATTGTTLCFNVSYSYSDYNSVTKKTYEHTYISRAYSYVEAISTPAGIYSYRRTWVNFGVGQTTKNRSYIAASILGASTYGTLDAGLSSIDYNSSEVVNTYGAMLDVESNGGTSKTFNCAYANDTNRPKATVYRDASVQNTLADLNLRVQTWIPQVASDSDEAVEVHVSDLYENAGFVKTYSDDTTDSRSLSSDSTELGLSISTSTIKDLGSSFLMYFNGIGPAQTVSTSENSSNYTITINYKTPASGGFAGVYVRDNFNVSVTVYNKGALRSMIESCESTEVTGPTDATSTGKGTNPQSWYYSSGWAGYQSAYSYAKSILDKPITTQAVIDQATLNLEEAYDNLQFEQADYTLATAYYNQASEKSESQYTTSSWTALKRAMTNYSTGYSVLYQPAVDVMASDLKTALDGLEEANANYDELNAEVAVVNSTMLDAQDTYGLDASAVYSNWGTVVSNLTTAGYYLEEEEGLYILDDSKTLLISQQASVDAFVINLTKAVDALKLVSADYTKANAAISSYNSLINSSSAYLTTAFLNEALAAYNALNAKLNLTIADQSEVDSATDTLNEVLARPTYKPSDTTQANKLLTTAKTLDKTKYKSFTAVDSAITSLESKLSLDIRYQSQINSAVEALQSAIDALEEVSADYSGVETAKAKVNAEAERIKNLYADSYGYLASNYYSNWGAVETAVNGVDYTLTISKQSQVDAYAKAINDAYDALTIAPADYSVVNEYYTQANDIVQNHSDIYTESSIENLASVMFTVVYNKKINEQATVDKMAEDLKAAINSLEKILADYTQVNAQISIAQSKISTDDAFKLQHPGYSYYTESSISKLKAAVDAVVFNKAIDEQTTVDSYATAIASKLTLLVVAPADYTAVNLAIASVPSDLSNYTTETAANVTTAVNAVVTTKKADNQSVVDGYAASINTAVAALKYKAADYSQVNTAVNQAKALTESKYTAETWAVLTAAVNKIDYTKDITEQSTVTAYATDIYAAIKALKYVDADYSAVEAAKALAPSDLSIYTTDSVSSLNSAISAVVYNLNITHQSEVDAYAAAINKAVSGLVLLDADYTAVNTAVSDASKLVQANYTAESWAVLNSAIEKIDYKKNINQQSEVDAYAADINTAIANLKYADADYSAVEAAKALAPSDLSIYTTDSVSSLNSAISAVVYGLDITHQSEVDAYASSISDAVNKLEVADADYTAVEKAISDSQTYTQTDYTVSTWNNLQNAIDAVVYGKKITEQSEVDAYAADINTAIAALVKKGDYTQYLAQLERLRVAKENAEAYFSVKYEYNSYFSNATANEVSQKYASANALVLDENEVQSVIDANTADLKDYVDSLVLNTAYYIELNNLINSYKSLDISDYSNYDSINTNYVQPLFAKIDGVTYTTDNQAVVDATVIELQSYIDMLTQAVIFAAAEGSTTVIDKSSMAIYGLDTRVSAAAFKSSYITFKNCDVNVEPLSGRYMGTGSTVQITYQDGTVETYTIVLVGDINGDGQINSNDAATLSSDIVSGGLSDYSDAMNMASNINGDRRINSTDVAMLKRALLGIDTIDQTGATGV